MIFLRKYNELDKHIKASLWYTICNFFQKGVSFLVIPLYVRLLSTEEYGKWSVFQSWAGLLIIFASLNLYAGVFTKSLIDIPNYRERNTYTSSMQGLGTFVSLIFFVIYMLNDDCFSAFIGVDKNIMILLFLYFVVYPAISFWNTRQKVEYKYISMVIVTIVMTLLTPTISILLLKYTSLRADALILGYLFVQCGVGLFFYIWNFWKGKCFYNKKYWKYAVKFNVPLIPHYVSLIILGQSDRIMIKHYCGESDAGIYSFAYQIANMMSVFLSAINGVRVPWSYEKLKDRGYRKLKEVTNYLCVLMGIITVGVALLAPDLVKVFGTSEYEKAIFVIPIVSLGVYFTFIYDVFCTVEFYYGSTSYVMIASVSGALLNILLNALLLPRYGMIAAAYTTMVSYLGFMLMHYFFMRRVLTSNGIQNNIYDIHFMIVVTVILLIVLFLIFMTYKNNLIRYISVIVFVILGIIFKDKIKKVISLLRRKRLNS